MGLTDGSDGLRGKRPRAPSNPWEKEPLASWDSAGRTVGGKSQGTWDVQVRLFGAQSQVQIQRID